MSRIKAGALKSHEPIRIGFVPSTDSAALIYAKESGLFEQQGLEVELKREITWSGIGDKLINGELDAAQAPAPLPFLANLEVDSDPSALVSAMVTSSQGSAITISRRLWGEGVQSPGDLLDLRRAWKRDSESVLTRDEFGPVVLRQCRPGKRQNTRRGDEDGHAHRAPPPDS